MTLWVANITGFDYNTLMDMPVPELQEWYESSLDFHEERLQEQADLIREGQPTDQSGDNSRENDFGLPPGFV